MEPATPSVPRSVRPTAGLAVASALATFWFSAAIGCVAVRRWRRAAFWLVTDWVWFAVMIAGIISGHPRLMWGGLVAFVGWRIPAAVDAYRLVRSGIEQAGWPTLVRAWVVLTIGAIVAARGIVRPFFVEAFTIPSGSMYPTLVVGDHIFIDKRGWTPRRGDVVVFEFPLDRSTDYVKRVIGLPGDVIETSDGNVSVNGQVLARERIVDGCPEGADGLPAVEENIPCVIWDETIEGRSYRVGTERRSGRREVPRTVVPAGTVFVVGDNRDNSSDSRVWGPVPLENIKGEVRLIWWSKDRTGVRWDRVDTQVS